MMLWKTLRAFLFLRGRGNGISRQSFPIIANEKHSWIFMGNVRERIPQAFDCLNPQKCGFSP
jgi:hypothetical protein